MATTALFAVFFRLFAAALRWAALTGRFAAAETCRVAVAAELFRFRFRSLASAAFVLARAGLPVLRATCRTARAVDAGLLFATRLRALDDDALAGRFEVGFTRDAAPVFFVLELVGFFDFLRAAIVNLSTREHRRIRSNSRARTHLQDPRANTALQEGKLTLCRRNHPRPDLRTLSGFRSTVKLSFSTKPSKNQRRRYGGDPGRGGVL
ncbi:MAG TPA: hypothetical protein VN637_02685 [Roseiarcus sp.]|nr:hypothetical protein [Roseiarcus sp.]